MNCMNCIESKVKKETMECRPCFNSKKRYGAGRHTDFPICKCHYRFTCDCGWTYITLMRPSL